VADLALDQQESLARIHEQAAADAERLLVVGRLRTTAEQATLLAFHGDLVVWHRQRAQEIRDAFDLPAAPGALHAARTEGIRTLAYTLARWAADEGDGTTAAWLGAHSVAAAASLDLLTPDDLTALAADVSTALAAVQTKAPSAWSQIAAQRARNHAKWGDESIENQAPNYSGWLPTLGEEFGEICRALTSEQGDPVRLRAELIDLAAVALMWLDSIDRAEPPVGEANHA
jgi:NTP pyrophosphatase (non-canonical NTP hydrolase)